MGGRSLRRNGPPSASRSSRGLPQHVAAVFSRFASWVAFGAPRAAGGGGALGQAARRASGRGGGREQCWLPTEQLLHLLQSACAHTRVSHTLGGASVPLSQSHSAARKIASPHLAPSIQRRCTSPPGGIRPARRAPRGGGRPAAVRRRRTLRLPLRASCARAPPRPTPRRAGAPLFSNVSLAHHDVMSCQ